MSISHQIVFDGSRFMPGMRASAGFAYLASRLLNRAHGIAATLAGPSRGVEGVLVAHGSIAGGYCLFIQDEHLHYVHNYLGVLELHVTSREPLPVRCDLTEKCSVRFQFEPSGLAQLGISRGTPGWARLFIDDRLVGEKHWPVTLPFALAIGGGVSIGRDPGRGVSRHYDPPFAFTGELDLVEYRLEHETVEVYRANALDTPLPLS